MTKYHRLNRRRENHIRRCIDLEQTRNFGFTGWTDVREVEYVGAMDPEAEARSIHRMNRRLGLGERRCSCPESWFFQSSQDNYTHRLNRHSIGWLPLHAMASFLGGQFSITGWIDDGYWRCVGLTGVKYFLAAFLQRLYLLVLPIYTPKAGSFEGVGDSGSSIEDQHQLHPLYWG